MSLEVDTQTYSLLFLDFHLTWRCCICYRRVDVECAEISTTWCRSIAAGSLHTAFHSVPGRQVCKDAGQFRHKREPCCCLWCVRWILKEALEALEQACEDYLGALPGGC